MKNQLINAISSGVHGKWTHMDPLKVIVGLTPTTARKKPKDGGHSCWELLHHIVVWQDTLINHIKGEKLNWNEIEQKTNWPTSEELAVDSNLGNLTSRFETGIEEVKTLVKSVDFIKTSKGFPELSTIKLFLVLLQHTSHHIGQMITVRQILGDWPPITNEK